MISDESSSDSETGRFKCRVTDKEPTKSSTRRDDHRSGHRSKPSENDRFRRDFEKRRDERGHAGRGSRERYNRSSRYSPVNRRKNSRDRSPDRRPRDRHGHSRNVRVSPKVSDHRSNSKDKHISRTRKSPERKRDFKEEIKLNISKEKSPQNINRKSKEKISSSPEFQGKKSVVQKPVPIEVTRKKSMSPIIVEDHVESDKSEEVQPGSYYSMIPAVVKEKSEESSEIDSSDDEKLRAKLLNIEKKLHKTKKKRQKKKHKKKKSKDRDQETSNSVEVTSTTDIDKGDILELQPEVAEVTSTQKNIQKEISEEGEISSDEESQSSIEIDPTDLRHKLKRSVRKDVCGPALPPHLEKHFRESQSPDTEGPALPPHFQKERNLGPSIPDDVRKILAKREVIKYASSDEEGIGPLPTGAEERWSDAHRRLEERALEIKIKQLDGHSLRTSEIKTREQWMLELPEAKAKYIGLEARTFRAKAGPDMSDRSSWTDTPEEKARKAAGHVREADEETTLQREAHARIISNRDDEQEKAIRKHKKKHKRDESLLEMHQRKLKKKKKKDEKDDEKKERRPFSRDVDLQVNRFDDAQKKSIIKKAQDLNSRFSRGDAKFL